MKQLPSPEFRKVYPRLQEPVEVTALGRVIGTWTPGRLTITVAASVTAHDVDPSFANDPKPGFRPTSQAKRDAILRRISKS